jgi:thymidylate synthase ThyX
MAIKDIRKLAHQMIDELKEEDLSKVIKTMRYIKIQNNEVEASDDNGFPLEKPTDEEIGAIKQAKREFANGEYYSHEKVFGEEDHV